MRPDDHAPHREPVDPGIHLLVCRRLELRRWSHDNLSAPYWRLYHNADAGASIGVGDTRVPLDPGAIFLIPPDTPFSSWAERAVRHLYIHFSVSAVHEHGPTVYRIPAAGAVREILGRLERCIVPGHLGRDGGEESVVPGLALDAVALVCLALGAVPASRFRDRYGEPRVDRVVGWMRERLPERSRASDWGRVAGLHPVALARLFRKITGRTPSAVLRGLRVREACLLLHHTGLSVDDIAERTGFCDRYHFSRAFRAERGVGPATFRRQLVG